jgi:hypothetical protein
MDPSSVVPTIVMWRKGGGTAPSEVRSIRHGYPLEKVQGPSIQARRAASEKENPSLAFTQDDGNVKSYFIGKYDKEH